MKKLFILDTTLQKGEKGFGSCRALSGLIKKSAAALNLSARSDRDDILTALISQPLSHPHCKAKTPLEAI